MNGKHIFIIKRTFNMIFFFEKFIIPIRSQKREKKSKEKQRTKKNPTRGI